MKLARLKLGGHKYGVTQRSAPRHGAQHQCLCCIFTVIFVLGAVNALTKLFGIELYQIHMYLNSDHVYLDSESTLYTLFYIKIHISGNPGVHDRVFVYTVAASLHRTSWVDE